MAKKRVGHAEPVDARVYDRFECLIRFREASPAATKRSRKALEVHPRAPEARVPRAVDIHIWSESHFFCGLSGDITQGGVFISTYLALRVGSAIDLEFSMANTGATLQARGEVRWVRESSVKGAAGIGIGFEDLSAADRRRIHEFCTGATAISYAAVG